MTYQGPNPPCPKTGTRETTAMPEAVGNESLSRRDLGAYKGQMGRTAKTPHWTRLNRSASTLR